MAKWDSTLKPSSHAKCDYKNIVLYWNSNNLRDQAVFDYILEQLSACALSCSSSGLNKFSVKA
jgi:hypothetical protein